MIMTDLAVKRALISVSDKQGIVECAQKLFNLGVEIISTGGTAETLRQAGIRVKMVSEVTQFPEIMNGRVKTLHPFIHGGILGQRDIHQKEALSHHIDWIDLVICSLYPFARVIQDPKVDLNQALENIDIGGVTMIRAAAKNFNWVSVIVDPTDYLPFLEEMIQQQSIGLETRKKLATKAFAYTAQYDAIINQYFSREAYPEILNLTFNKVESLRYGENPHQTACLYRDVVQQGRGILAAEKIQGKQLSYNNIVDADAAVNCLMEFSGPACVVVKHTNPCGVAVGIDIGQAFMKGFYADEKSAFGGIVALNRRCTKEIAQVLSKVFLEILIACEFEPEALQLLSSKPNLRLLDLGQGAMQRNAYQFKSVNGGVLMQSSDTRVITREDLKVVTQKQPDEHVIDTMLFGWKVIKHVKSNAIIVVKDQVTLGIGAGQMSRVDAVELALSRSKDDLEEAVLVSDAFFPFRDSMDRIAGTGIKAIIQPGGSIRDEEVIRACDEHGISMVFTRIRCFNH
jgi:phosphoribosylaminoimidazolecarboxamide formyltransferase/IMP cyclohydrolase